MKKYLKAIFWGLCFIIFTILVKVIDVEPAGAQGSLIGFASLNLSVNQLLGTNHFCYLITQLFGLLAIFLAAVFAVMGFVQLIKRKSLLKVDHEILMVGIVYAIVIILYVLFEKLAINYRPVVLEDGLEASYPSTHTMLILTILGTALPLAGRYISNPKIALLAKLLCIVIMWLTVVCRLLSGVHWFTDIIGGVLISLCLISLFKSLLRR
jgi:undecaprenyl-diphosphatase